MAREGAFTGGAIFDIVLALILLFSGGLRANNVKGGSSRGSASPEHKHGNAMTARARSTTADGGLINGDGRHSPFRRQRVLPHPFPPHAFELVDELDIGADPVHLVDLDDRGRRGEINLGQILTDEVEAEQI